MERIKTEYGYKEVWGHGLVQHYNHKGERHHPQEPAVVWPCGDIEYWINGLRHRTDGPAIVCTSGYKAY